MSKRLLFSNLRSVYKAERASLRILTRQVRTDARTEALKKSMATPLKPLDVWVDELITRIFFQPDDALALSTFEEDISPTASFEVNGQAFDAKTYLAIAKGYRSASVGKSLSNPTLAMSLSDDEGKGGVVGQCGKFSTTDKVTGKEVRQTSVTIVKVEWVTDEAGVGRRMFSQLTEVISDD